MMLMGFHIDGQLSLGCSLHFDHMRAGRAEASYVIPISETSTRFRFLASRP
jgi:hypothetical protein